MVVLKTQSEFGHAPPPQTPYSIVTNLPGWKTAEAVRDGDMAPVSRLKHIYPRFMPTFAAGELGQAIAKYTHMEGHMALVYLNPVMWPYTRRHVSHEARREHKLAPDAVTLKIVDVGHHRVYTVLFKPQDAMGVMMSWGNPGLGLSIRGAEDLMRHVDGITEVSWVAPELGDGSEPEPELPAPTWAPESPAHSALRDRISSLLHRAPVDEERVVCSPRDIFLYPTGMAAVFHATSLMQEYRPGAIAILGVLFHNSYHHLLDECPNGLKHFGKVDDAGLDAFEAWLDAEKQAGRDVSYAIVEVPGNPTLDTPDVQRLSKLSEKYGFVLILDDTIGSFANVDVLGHSSLLITSLTKSFSGRSDVMGGSVVLNPLSPHYQALSEHFASTHHNELFASDAAVLLDNSHDYLQRTAVLNRNASALAAYFAAAAAEAGSPVRAVQYPELLPSRPHYDAVRRPAEPELPAPGYGGLLSVQFRSKPAAIAFYDSCGFYPSPHLGGHVTIMMSYNSMAFGKRAEEREYMRELGLPEESVRFAVGLEAEEDILDTAKAAMEAAKAVAE